MDHHDLYHSLRLGVGYDADEIPIDEHVRVANLTFCSESEGLLPGDARYVCPVHGTVLHEAAGSDETEAVGSEVPFLHSAHVPENREFRYHVFMPADVDRARDVVLMFHGFNEKYWHKYLPWAHRLVTQTGKTVVLFPIASHMNRVPVAWSDRRLMHRLSGERRRRFPSIVASTLSNAAISTRLQARPQRFIWSGLQTYGDAIQLMRDIRAGTHPLVAPAARIDLFGFSIGCLLAQILLMTDPGGIFAHTRLCLFCGGAVFNRMSPVSRFILDSECNVALYSYLVEHLESHLRDNERLRHFLGDEPPAG